MAEFMDRMSHRNETQARDLRGGERARERLPSGLPVTERRLRLNGVWTALLEGGDGPPIVLLHGPGEYAAAWFPVIPDLAADHRVIAPDLPGHGGSDAIDAPVDANRILGWVDDLIERTCSSPPVLVGQTIGGAIAARYASRHGERISRLVLVDSLGLTPFQPTPEFGRALTDYVSHPDEETHDRLWSRCAFDLGGLRNRLGERWEWLKAYNLDRAHAEALRPTQQGLMEQFGFPAIPSTELARVTAHTTLIWGRHDLATPLPVAESASVRYGWPLHVIDQAADGPPMEQPEAFSRALRRVLEH